MCLFICFRFKTTTEEERWICFNCQNESFNQQVINTYNGMNAIEEKFTKLTSLSYLQEFKLCYTSYAYYIVFSALF